MPFFLYFPSLSPPSLFLPSFPSLLSPLWTGLAAHESKHLGFFHHHGLLLTSAPDFWLYPSSNVLRSLATCMLFHSGKEALLSWDTGIMGAMVSHPEAPLNTARSTVDTQPSNSPLRSSLIWKASLCPGPPTHPVTDYCRSFKGLASHIISGQLWRALVSQPPQAISGLLWSISAQLLLCPNLLSCPLSSSAIP